MDGRATVHFSQARSVPVVSERGANIGWWMKSIELLRASLRVA
jgi:hypothetical protein